MIPRLAVLESLTDEFDLVDYAPLIDKYDVHRNAITSSLVYCRKCGYVESNYQEKYVSGNRVAEWRLTPKGIKHMEYLRSAPSDGKEAIQREKYFAPAWKFGKVYEDDTKEASRRFILDRRFVRYIRSLRKTAAVT